MMHPNAVMAVLMVVGACAAPTTGARSTPVPTAEPGPRPEGVLVALDLPDGRLGVERRPFASGAAPVRLFDTGPGVGVGALPGHFQTVTDERPDVGGGHFDAAPRLRVHTSDGSVVADLGRANPAVASDDGRALAWLAPRADATCHEDDCLPPDADLVVAPVDAVDRRRTVGRFGSPAGPAWVGEREVLVLAQPGRATIVTLEGDRRAIALTGEPAAFGSGHIGVTRGDGRVLRVLDTHGTTVWERSFAPARINAVFAPGTRTLLVQTVSRQPDGLAEGGIVVADLVAHRTRALTETRANGDLLWSADGAWFGYRREAEAGFELVVCRADGEACRTELTWTDGIRLLAFDRGPDGEEVP